MLMDKKGFTVIELMTIVAVIAILCIIAIPAFSSWIPSQKLKSTTRRIYSDIGLAKSRAVSENSVSVVIFNLANDTYTVFMDNGPGAASGNWALDSGETILCNGVVEDGVDIYNSTFVSHTYGYNNRGLPQSPLTGPYEVHMKNDKNQYLGIRVSAVGALSIIKSTDGGTTWE
jgi:Tfp pilus assembly protein FimT